MVDPSENNSSEEMFRCPRCGNMFPTESREEAECPVCGTVCTRDKCLALNASNGDY